MKWLENSKALMTGESLSLKDKIATREMCENAPFCLRVHPNLYLVLSSRKLQFFWLEVKEDKCSHLAEKLEENPGRKYWKRGSCRGNESQNLCINSTHTLLWPLNCMCPRENPVGPVKKHHQLEDERLGQRL